MQTEEPRRGDRWSGEVATKNWVGSRLPRGAAVQTLPTRSKKWHSFAPGPSLEERNLFLYRPFEAEGPLTPIDTWLTRRKHQRET